MALSRLLHTIEPPVNHVLDVAIAETGRFSAGVTSDIAAEASLGIWQFSQQRLAFALETSGDALWSFEVSKNHFTLIGRWWSALGYQENDIDPTLEGWYSLAHPDDRSRLLRCVTAHIWGRTQAIEIEYRARTKTGGFVWTLARGKIAATNSDGRPTLMIGTLIDINRIKERELVATHNAHHDPLTGLPTRRTFCERLAREISAGVKFALLACDLDDFKLVNDRLGHAAGDELLCIVGQRLKNAVRSKDLVARVGGDEFMIVLGKIQSRDDASKATCRVAEAIAHPMSLRGHSVEVGVSVGIAIGPEDGKTADDLCSYADAALYKSKAGHLPHTRAF